MAIANAQSLRIIKERFDALSSTKKLTLILGIAAVFAILVGAWIWSRPPEYRVLFSNYNEKDGGAIVGALQQMNIPYKVGEGGNSILVPSEQVYDLRLKLAQQGLPKGGNVGFELMDNQKLGISQFAEQINYQRSVEGELAKTIQALGPVAEARVHLAIPKPSVFIREQEKPSASVMLTLHPGRLLDGAQVGAVAHLVSSSIPNMPLKNVTVLDQHGNLLTSNLQDSMNSGLNPTQLSYLGQIEQGYSKRIESILSPIVGKENVRAQVTASIDFSQAEQTAETYRPNPNPTESAVRSQQSTESNGTDGQPPSGVPGALSNQPPGAASAPIVAPLPAQQNNAASSNSHKESTVNYELDKTVRHVKFQVGSIKRLSAAVVVNYRKVADKNTGESSLKPLTAQEMAQINNLVKEAMGYSGDRGDTLNVVNASFNGEGQQETSFWQKPENIAKAEELLKFLIIVGVILFIVMGVIRPVLRDMLPRPDPSVTFGPDGQVLGVHGVPVIADDDGGGESDAYEEILRMIKEMAKNDPRMVSTVIKEWINQDE